jgi:hypothetical protein
MSKRERHGICLCPRSPKKPILAESDCLGPHTTKARVIRNLLGLLCPTSEEKCSRPYDLIQDLLGREGRKGRSSGVKDLRNGSGERMILLTQVHRRLFRQG